MSSQTTVKSQTYTYGHPHLTYTESQVELLGLSNDRFQNDKDMPMGANLGGIKPIMLAPWKKGFNPVEEAPALDIENKPFSILDGANLFKPITQLNRRKEASRSAYLKYVDRLEVIGREMMDFRLKGSLTEEGIKLESQKLISEFIGTSLDGILMVAFEENAKLITDALKKLAEFPKPKSTEEILIDIEIRSVFRNDNALRQLALIGDISLRHCLALSRSEAPISGFSKEEFDTVIFGAAVRENIKEAHQIEMLYAINSTLWLLMHRTISGLTDFSYFLEDEKRELLETLGLNWQGTNLMSELDSAKYFLETAVKQENNKAMSEKMSQLPEKLKKMSA